MTYKEAKTIRQGDLVEHVGGTTCFRLVVSEIVNEGHDYFVRCSNGKLYHHTALKKIGRRK